VGYSTNSSPFVQPNLVEGIVIQMESIVSRSVSLRFSVNSCLEAEI
jgi:hypothetical protein